MKARFLPYLRLQARRAAHYLPHALIIGLFLLCALGVYAVSAGNAHANEEGQTQFEIGVVGEVKEPYFDAMLFAVNHLSDSQIALKLTRMDEAAARRRLNAGQISAYVLIPDGFEERLVAMDPLPLTYVFSPTSTGISTALGNEVIRGVVPVLLEGQNAMHGLRRCLRANFPAESVRAHTDAVTEKYVVLIFNRARLFERVETGVVAGKGFIPYLFTSLFVFLILIWGVACAPLFSRKRCERERVLSASGLGPVKQIASEYAAYLGLVLTGVVSAALVIGFGLYFAAPEIFQLLFFDGEEAFRYLLRAMGITVVFSALQFLLYELARNTVAALLAQTFTAVFLGYVSGCFYSSDFFPRALQRISAFLPTGAAIRFLSGTGPLSAWLLAGYFVCFMLLIVWRRWADLKGDAV